MESVHSEIIIATPCKDCDPTKQPPLKRVYPLGFFSETGESLYEEIDKGDGTIDTGDDDDNSQLEPIVCITTYRDSTLCSSDKRCVWSAGFCWDSSTGTYTSAATPSKGKSTDMVSVGPTYVITKPLSTNRHPPLVLFHLNVFLFFWFSRSWSYSARSAVCIEFAFDRYLIFSSQVFRIVRKFPQAAPGPETE